MKILIISRNTFPKQGPRAFRTAELSEELARQGHKIVLYSVQGSFDYTDYENSTGIVMKNIKTNWATEANDGSIIYNMVDKILYHAFHRLFFFPDIEFRYLINDIIKKNPGFDLLITIAYPHSIHMGAARAKKKYPNLFPKKWIADCGDPFFFNPFINAPRYMEKYEREWCELADYITIPIKEGMKGYFPEYHHKIRIIPQGFDFSKTPITDYKKNDIPTFAYAGSLYGKRDPIGFVKFLSKYSRPFKFCIFTRGTLPKEYKDLLGGKLEIIVGKNRQECIFELSKMDFLINFTNPSAIQSPSKLIDYGIAKRPILNVNIPFDNYTEFDEFMEANYLHQHQIDNLDDYKIENVAKKILSL